MNEMVKAFLVDVRVHPGFAEFIKYMEVPSMPLYKKGRHHSTEKFGADTIFASGQITEHEKWISVLTGKTSQPNRSYE